MAKTAQISSIRIGRRARVDENLPNNWENIDINTFTIPKDKKAVFMLGGNNTNRVEANNGNAKIVSTSLNESNTDKTEVYSFMYETEPIRNSGEYLSAEYVKEAKALYQKVFKPILFDSKGRMKEPKGIEQEFTRMVFVAHCGGCSFVDIIIDEFYNTLLEKYPIGISELLIGKIKYIGYAPCELPRHNVNALFITPYVDVNYSWAKAFENAEREKVDVDYPRGVMTKLFTARKKGSFQYSFDEELKNTRAIMFKTGNMTYFIPNQINPDKLIGDHSIDCIGKSKYWENPTEYAINGRLANYAFKTYLNRFLNSRVVDMKETFSNIARKIESCNNKMYTITKK